MCDVDTCFRGAPQILPSLDAIFLRAQALSIKPNEMREKAQIDMINEKGWFPWGSVCVKCLGVAEFFPDISICTGRSS